jgi:hypothetical protein
VATTARGGSVTLAEVVQFGNTRNHAARFEVLVTVLPSGIWLCVTGRVGSAFRMPATVCLATQRHILVIQYTGFVFTWL